MKKFIFTANVIALLFLVPALLIAYLTTDKKTTGAKVVSGEVAKQANTGIDYGNLISIVKTF